jgi:hypothetical protein
MKEKKEPKDPKPKQENKPPKQNNNKPKQQKAEPEKVELENPRPEKTKSQKGRRAPKPKNQTPQVQEEVKPVQEEKPVQVAQPTPDEIEGIKEEILEHGLLNPYALILYNYMRVSSYETNVQVVLSMRKSMLAITKINQVILDELNENKEE